MLTACSLPFWAPHLSRSPITYREATRFVSEYLFGIILVMLSYMLVCSFRNYREYFASDIYSKALKRELVSWHYLALEVPSSIFVFIAISFLSRVKDNRNGLFAVLSIVLAGAALCLSITWFYQNDYLGEPTMAGVIWIECIGAGTYLMYIPMGILLFDRLIACTEFAGTAIFLVNSADVFGQAASLGIVVYRELNTRNRVANSADFHK